MQSQDGVAAGARREAPFNTLRIDQAPPNRLKLGATDLFASILLRLTKAFGPGFPRNLWLEAAVRPAAKDTQDAVDNLELAAGAATASNLSEVFIENWRWPVSDAAQNEAKRRFGDPIALPR